MRRSTRVRGRATAATVGRRHISRKTLLRPCPREAVGSGTWPKSSFARAVRTRLGSPRGSPATRRGGGGGVSARLVFAGAAPPRWRRPTARGPSRPRRVASAARAVAPFELRRLGLHERRGAALVRLCRSLELERLHDLPTDAVVRRIERERGLGPWSAGVVCLEGLGRFEHGLVGDLGLVKLVRALRGRRVVETWETAELLEPYGEWAGLASVYLLARFGPGLNPPPSARAA